MNKQCDIAPGAVVWAKPDPTIGREQTGNWPAVVVSSRAYIDIVTELLLVVPITTINRSWPNQVLLSGPTGLSKPSYAMTEQLRAISRQRLTKMTGTVDHATLKSIMAWIADFLVQP